MKQKPMDKEHLIQMIEELAKKEGMPELDWGTLLTLIVEILTTEPLSHETQATLTGIATSALKKAGKEYLSELSDKDLPRA